MQGTILVIDGVSTNRIALKVQLADAFFDVVQAGDLKEMHHKLRICTPDLIITALAVSDGTACDVKSATQREERLRNVPVIAVDAKGCTTARLDALAAGVEDVICHPIDDLVLHARIRSLLRARSAKEELRLQRDAAGAMRHSSIEFGQMEPLRAATVALVTETKLMGRNWKKALEEFAPFGLRCHDLTDIRGLMSAPVPDAIVIELNPDTAGLGLRLVADLRARAATRQSIIVALPDQDTPEIAAEALDRGAHDVVQSGFNPAELAMRLRAQLTQKLQEDRLRASIHSELKAASSDMMTGLHNRRYAMPFLDRVLQDARATGESFALMVADLDHFKQVNDLYGHPVGDAVLIETAARLKMMITPKDLLARIGGEEFLFVLPGQSASDAAKSAADFCDAINERPFRVAGIDQPIKMTISVGAVIGSTRQMRDLSAADLIAKADQALYAAKNAGRNRVSVSKQSPVAA
ncbi:diguanylate cyclase [Epibacterium sp. SM1979]|uniref:diguanylate cyclase n=1 Tax=Tritonibacter litoralis TaxID=2662264 RepID=A0A843YHH1_9RHOB|nr:diguanylate cyclase [Tritonibacter litoralis]